ncbi:PKD domain-containing protein [Draconibacterium sp. IB214405]|uniref:PKD domain-containing protein n=1 Tax=Draconibacterium sp. IB214405 TaxID=3097352 RepID=UPI002A0D5A5A|nr:PKD domain-containing protein [Draconibacterium sp. IB214405]MDX8337551.1 PKD domain-containing protein [Draconibacterium sp. IB214405]
MKNLKKYNIKLIAIAVIFSLFYVACQEDFLDPTGDFSYEAGSPNTLEVSFSPTGTSGVSALWDFGDGETTTLISPTHTYAAGGNYTVRLTINGEEGTSPAIIEKMVTVMWPDPTGKITSVVSDLTVTFTGTTTNSVSVEWDFGDGSTSTEANPTHTYADFGTYTVTLTVTGEEGTTPAVVTKTISMEQVAGVTKLEGTIIGHESSWDDNPATYVAAAFDGDFSTFVDAPGPEGWVGYDLGEGNKAKVTLVKYARRDTEEAWGVDRLVGAQIRGSNDPNYLDTYDVLYTISERPTKYEFTEAVIEITKTYRYIYLYTGNGYGNVAELEFYGEMNPDETPVQGVKVEGEIFGHDGSWDGVNGLIGDAFDGDLFTFVDAPGEYASTGFVGYDFGAGNKVQLTMVKYAPRDEQWASRVNGAEIRGTNDETILTDPANATYDVLHTIITTPPVGVLSEDQVSAPGSYRFIYYYTAPDGYCNVAELEFYGIMNP